MGGQPLHAADQHRFCHQAWKDGKKELQSQSQQPSFPGTLPRGVGTEQVSHREEHKNNSRVFFIPKSRRPCVLPDPSGRKDCRRRRICFPSFASHRHDPGQVTEHLQIYICKMSSRGLCCADVLSHPAWLSVLTWVGGKSLGIRFKLKSLPGRHVVWLQRTKLHSPKSLARTS